MTDIPIIFSKPMILALIAGRKTMTRRLVWGKKAVRRKRNMHGEWGEVSSQPLSRWQRVKVGDRLWVREAWSHDGPDMGTVRARAEDVLPGGERYGPYYRATEVAPETLAWITPMFMPRWASRLALEVTAVRVERLRASLRGYRRVVNGILREAEQRDSPF